MPDAKHKSIPICIKADDKTVNDKQSISELFNAYFTSTQWTSYLNHAGMQDQFLTDVFKFYLDEITENHWSLRSWFYCLFFVLLRLFCWSVSAPL